MLGNGLSRCEQSAKGIEANQEVPFRHCDWFALMAKWWRSQGSGNRGKEGSQAIDGSSCTRQGIRKYNGWLRPSVCRVRGKRCSGVCWCHSSPLTGATTRAALRGDGARQPIKAGPVCCASPDCGRCRQHRRQTAPTTQSDTAERRVRVRRAASSFSAVSSFHSPPPSPPEHSSIPKTAHAHSVSPSALDTRHLPAAPPQLHPGA